MNACILSLSVHRIFNALSLDGWESGFGLPVVTIANLVASFSAFTV